MAKGPNLTQFPSNTLSVAKLNEAFTKINTAFENTISRDGSTPNSMSSDIDLNSNDILNVKNIVADEITINGNTLSGSVLAAANSASAALASETAAALSAKQAALFDNIFIDDVIILLADTTLSYSAGPGTQVSVGDYIQTRAEGFSYEIAASGASDHHLTTAGGVKLYVLPGVDGYSVKAFGAVGDGVTDDTAAIQNGINSLYAKHLASGDFFRLCIPSGVFIHNQITNKNGVVLSGVGGILKFKDNVAVNAGTNYYPISDIGYNNTGYENLIIVGNGANNSLFTVCDSLTIVGQYSWAYNIRIEDAPDSGVMFSGAEGAWIDMIRVLTARDAGVYVNNSDEVNPDSEGAYIGRVWTYDCVYSGVSFKRSSTRISVDSIFAKRCGNAVAFEDFGAGSGGSPSILQINQISAYDIGYMHRASGASETLITANRTRGVYIGSVIGRNVSGIGLAFGGSENFVIGHVDITGYAADPITGGNGNAGIILTSRSGVRSTGVVILSGKLSGFVNNGVVLQDATECRILLESVSAGNRGLRVEALSSNCVVAGKFDGALDLEFLSGATNINLSGCTFPDQTGIIAQSGGLRSTTVISPVNILTPRWLGQLCEVTTGGQRFIATGLTSADWLQLGTTFRIESAADIANAADTVNTSGKYQGQLVWDATNNRMMRSSGSTPTSVWHVIDGSISVTPV